MGAGFRILGWWCLALSALSLGAVAPMAQTLIQAPRVAIPGWSMELLLQAPAVRHPSVVCTAPDGRIFIGEDPMDISTPRADVREGRILCRHPDGRITVFADRLYAPFGMQYLDGRLYVLHNPKFSVWEDGGDRGVHRLDLIEQTNPNAWALDWNDHVPANFRLGMDGYFYMAVGDKGLYGAVGRDGHRVDLPGGGILRLRPDGTGLEVFSLGVRNIMDVALNSEDELFTYDNTDEHEWMGRLTHMVEDGFYGYPHDFIPQRPYTLWCFADFGAGAATGTFAYTDDVLPVEYQDNLILADFGKRQLLRVRTERDGGSYRVMFPSNRVEISRASSNALPGMSSVEAFFHEPPEEFRPVGISPTADGSGILICDWQHRDSKDTNALCGRLWKLGWTGTRSGSPRPNWYVPAAQGKPFEALTSELIAGLSHGSREVRHCAQRRLTDRAKKSSANSAMGEEVISALKTVLTNTQAVALARLHALWALDGVDAGTSLSSTLADLVRDPSVPMRRQVIRQIGLRRTVEAELLLTPQLWNSDASIRRAAATAMGRMGDLPWALRILAGLDDSDLFARYAKFTALNRIGRRDPRVWRHLVRSLEAAPTSRQQSTMHAMRETFDRTLVDQLVLVVRDGQRPVEDRALALKMAASLHRQPPPWQGQWGAYHPFRNAPSRKTVDWDGTTVVVSTLNEMLTHPEVELRVVAVKGLADAGETNAAPQLRDLFGRETSPRLRQSILSALGQFADPKSVGVCMSVLTPVAANQVVLDDLAAVAIRTLERIGTPEAVEALIQFLQRPDADASLLRQAVVALGQLKASASVAELIRMTQKTEVELAARSATALGRIGGREAVAALMQLADHGAHEVRRAAIQSLGQLAAVEAVPVMVKAWSELPLRPEAFMALTRVPTAVALEAYLDGLSSRNPDQRLVARNALKSIRAELRTSLEGRVAQLAPSVAAELQQVYAGDPEAAPGPIFQAAIRVLTTADYLAAASAGGGDIAKGRALFVDAKGMNCIGCHRIAGAGGDVGPDLTGIGSQSDRLGLADSLLFPSRVVREGYQRSVLQLKDGEEMAGLIKAETTESVTLRDAVGSLHVVQKSEIQERRQTADSLMPEGLHLGLTVTEFTDLITFLASLRGNPPP